MRQQKRIRGRQDLQLDEQSLQILVETIPTLMWRAAPDGQIDYVNKRLLEYFGSPLEEIIGWGWMEKAHPNDVAFKAKTWLSNLETTTSHDVNCRFQGADGAYRWFNVRGEPLRDRDGSVRSWYGVFIDIDNQKQAEEKSRESELKLRQITETIPGLVWSTDPDGEPTHFNQRLLDYSGMRLEDFQHRGWETFLHPADFPETEKAFYHAIQTETSYEAVHRLRRSDGEYRWHHVRGEPLHDREGRIVQWYGLSVDIDERKRAEEELRNSEAKIRRLVDSNIIGIFIWDFDGRVLEANDEFLRVVNYDREDLVSGRVRWTNLTPPDWRERDKAEIEQHKISGRLEPFEKEYMRKDGSRVPVLIGVATFEESANEGVAFVLDLTERKRAEEKSRESELKLRQIVETLPGLVWSNAPDGEPSHINQRMLDYSGMPFEEFRHRGWEAFVHPADYPETAEAFWNTIQTGTSYQGAMRLRRADGEFRWHDARCEPLRDREGRIVQWYGLCVDIDERKKVEDQLRRSEAYLAEAERLSHTGGWAVNRKGERTIVYWSEECYRIFGFDPLQGLPTRDRVWQQVHPDDRSRLREAADAALGQKRDYVAAFRILLPEGTIKYLESNAHHLFSADGELLGVVGTFVDVTERKRADDALRESEARFRDFAETASDWFCEMGPDYKFTLLSENAFGSGAADRIGTAFWDHALDLETEPEKWRLLQETVFSRKPFRDFVYRGMSSDSSPMYVRASGKPLFDANGEFLGYRGTCTDATEIMHAQEALGESERSARSALDGIPGLVAVLAPTGELETVNRQVFEYFGRSLEELKNWGTSGTIHPEDLPRILELFKRAIASGIPFNFELRLRRLDSEYRWFENRHVPVRDDSGRIVRWYLLLMDIEDRKRAEQGLRESERNLRSVIDGIAGLVAVLAPNGELESVNRQLLEYFGRSLEWAKDWGTNDMVHPEDRPRAVESFTKAIASGLPYHTDQRLRGADGEYRWFETRGVPIRDDSGRIERWYVLLTDIEDRTRALARLDQMQGDFAHINRVSMMGELAASLSHEITQPIGSARNNARAALNFLDMQPPDLSEVREALSCVVGDTDRAGDIVDRIRDQIKKTPPRKARFDLNEAINEVIVLGRSAIIKNGVSVQTRLSEGLFPIHCDRVQLQQVVLNLILNAAEAMGSVEAEPRDLVISTEQHHAGVLVAVRDSGPGLDPSHLERVFDAFYTTKSRGMGMGLSICRSIVDAHGGRLWAEANEPRGTIFQFTLPAMQVEL